MTENNYGWDCVPLQISNAYISKCRLFSSDDNEFAKFRQDTDYKKILEGSDWVIGELNWARILDIYPTDVSLILEKLDEFKENDVYGTPTLLDYGELGFIAPATIKYISNALDIKALICYNQPKKIVEIGGGFGGMCKTLSVLYQFEEYILIDLPEVISLCKKYLSHFPKIKDKITYITTEEFGSVEKIENVNLFIADSSLAECNEETQRKYINKILINSDFAYIIYNTLHVGGSGVNYNYLVTALNDIFSIRTVSYSEVTFMFFTRR